MLHIKTFHIAQHSPTKPGKIEHLIYKTYHNYYYHQDSSHKSCYNTTDVCVRDVRDYHDLAQKTN